MFQTKYLSFNLKQLYLVYLKFMSTKSNRVGYIKLELFVSWVQVKVSGGTQTCTTELQANSSGSSQGHHYKSYSLTGPSASQLSQSVRDRLMLGSQSLPKPGSPEFTALFASAHHRERGTGVGPASTSFSPRVLKPSDGSLSDTCSNYAAPDLQGYYGTPNSPYTTSWMRHSNTYTPSGRSQGNLIKIL